MKIQLSLCLATVVSAVSSGSVAANPILTIRSTHDVSLEIVHDLTSLSRLPRREFTTTTIWTDRAMQFTGVPLLHLVRANDPDGTATVVRAYAINDYAIDIPVDTLTDTAPIVAYLIDGAPFGVRDLGPLWVVYPYDLAPEYRTEAVFARSIWQLRTLVLTDP